jgi:hypothetical protein
MSLVEESNTIKLINVGFSEELKLKMMAGQTKITPVSEPLDENQNPAAGPNAGAGGDQDSSIDLDDL